MYLTELFEDYCSVNLALKRESSKDEHRTVIRAFGRYLERPAKVTDLTRRTVMSFLTQLTLAEPTVNKYASSLRALWAFALEEELIDERLPRKSRMVTRPDTPLPECYSLDQMELILRACQKVSGFVIGCTDGLDNVVVGEGHQLPLFDRAWHVHWSDWWTSLVLVTFDTGWRIRDVLTRESADLQDGVLRCVTQKDREGSAIRLHEETMRVLEATHIERRKRLFPTPYKVTRGNHWFTPRFRKILQAADSMGAELTPVVRVPHTVADNDKPFHRIRKTRGTYTAAVQGDENAARLLGHSSVSIFQTHYLDRTKIGTPTTEGVPRPALPPRLRAI